jgi:hypothetical protein
MSSKTRLSFSTNKKVKENSAVGVVNKKPANLIYTPYPCFLYLEPHQNPDNYVLINGRYYFNDYDKDGSYLRRQFGGSS